MQVGTPDKIGRFKVEGLLGAGAMALVYKAYDPEINRPVAIKVLREEVSSDPEYRSRFLAEAKAAGNLVHPNIVTIFDVGVQDDSPYIAMEFLEGQTLEEEMESGRRFSIPEILRIGTQLAEALSYSHERKVVHRDIKPSNIMLSPDRKRARITDFGIAHIESPDKSEHTVVGTVLGTPQYMSPEQVEGLPVDGRSDLFSVGVILYQLITGEKPFTAGTLSSLFMKIVHEDPPPIHEREPDAPTALQRIVEKLLNKDANKRIQNGQDLARALRDVVREMEILEQRKAEAHLRPLRVKWTIMLALLVSIAMAVSAYFVHRKEVQAMSTLAMDFGGSLVEFVSAQSAEPVLLEDWIAVESFVDKTRQRAEITYLQIMDHKGMVRGSSDADEVGQPYQAPPNRREVNTIGNVAVSEITLNGASNFDFSTPILFKQREIGRVHLGLSKESLKEAANLTLFTMIGLMVAVVITVALVAYFLAASITAPMKNLRLALKEISQGAFGYRIEDQRNDELGQLFHEFNKMAESLENAHGAIERTRQDTFAGNVMPVLGAGTLSQRAATASSVGAASAVAAAALAARDDDVPTEVAYLSHGMEATSVSGIVPPAASPATAAGATPEPDTDEKQSASFIADEAPEQAESAAFEPEAPAPEAPPHGEPDTSEFHWEMPSGAEAEERESLALEDETFMPGRFEKETSLIFNLPDEEPLTESSAGAAEVEPEHTEKERASEAQALEAPEVTAEQAIPDAKEHEAPPAEDTLEDAVAAAREPSTAAEGGVKAVESEMPAAASPGETGAVADLSDGSAPSAERESDAAEAESPSETEDEKPEEPEEPEEPEWQMPGFIPSGWEDPDEGKPEHLNFEQEKEEGIDVDETQYMSFRRSAAEEDAATGDRPKSQSWFPEAEDDDEAPTQFFRKPASEKPEQENDDEEDEDVTRFMSRSDDSPEGKKPGRD